MKKLKATIVLFITTVSRIPLVFVVSRVAGWLAHWREQLADGRIYRPMQIYTGKINQSYIPMEDRT